MTRCNNCGSYVSDAYARVFGNNNNEVYACPSCERSRGMDTEMSKGSSGSTKSESSGSKDRRTETKAS